MQVYKCGLAVASVMPRQFRLLLVPSRLLWVEGACRLLEELLVGVTEKYLSLLECPLSLRFALPSA